MRFRQPTLHSVVNPWTTLMELGPYARVATAVAPFVAASALRLMFGKCRRTRLLLFLSIMWFTVNVLLAPYSAGMQQIFSGLGSIFR
jgi:hypothetical protein